MPYLQASLFELRKIPYFVERYYLRKATAHLQRKEKQDDLRMQGQTLKAIKLPEFIGWRLFFWRV